MLAFKRVLLSTCALGVLVSALPAFATTYDGGPVLLEGVDVTPVVKYFAEDVKIIERPVMIYNWSQNGESSFWDRHPQGDASLMAHTERLTESFWDNYGGDGGGNMYGYGLYTSTDPVATASYGGLYMMYPPAGAASPAQPPQPRNWLLLELQLPKGFRMLEVAQTPYDSSGANPNRVRSEEVRSLLKKFDCSPDQSANGFVSQGGSLLDKRCQDLGRKIFQDSLAIDGLAYDYGASNFAACDQMGQYMAFRAFVITDSKWLKPELVKYYTERTRDDLEARRRVQTLFYLAQETGGMYGMKPTDPAIFSLRKALKGFPDSFVSSSRNECKDDSCVITVKLCRQDATCTEVALDPIPRPGGAIMTQATALKTQSVGLLWSDLEGEKKSSTVTQWLKEYRFACAGSLPYEKSK